MHILRIVSIVLASLLTAVPAGADGNPVIALWQLNQKDIYSLVHHVPQPNALRLAELSRTFQDLECKKDDLREETKRNRKNLVCTLPGTSTETILVIAHYEHEGKGMGAVDDWSGAMMLPLLYHALTATQRKHTFVFAALCGDAGAEDLLHSMTHDQRSSIKAVIALEDLGLGPLRFYIGPNTRPDNPDPPSFYNRTNTPSDNQATPPNEVILTSRLLRAAVLNTSPEPKSSTPGSWLKIEDTRDFHSQNMTTILIHSVGKSTRNIPDSVKDTPDAIDSDAYYESYRLLCYYLDELDQVALSSERTH